MLFGLTKKEQARIISLVIFILVTLGAFWSKTPTENSPPIGEETPAPTTSPRPEVLSSITSSPSAQLYAVTKVVDGDTIKVKVGSMAETVRLVGINTPESVDPRSPVECLALEASAFAKSLVEGKQVMLQSDPTQSDRDRYGRLLRFVFLSDGTDVGLQLILEGFAHESLYSSKPHQYYPTYVEAQRQAQQLQKGLWNPAACPNDVRK